MGTYEIVKNRILQLCEQKKISDMVLTHRDIFAVGKSDIAPIGAVILYPPL